MDAWGRRMRELAPAHEEHWFEIYGRVARTGEAVRFENEARALNRWFDVYAFRVGRPEERRVAILFNDITERKRAEAAMREAVAEAARSRAQIEAVFQSVADGIMVCDMAGNFVFANEAEARIMTGKLRLDVRPVDPVAVVSAAADTARPAAEAKEIRLRTLLDPQAVPVRGDPDRLQQVVWNLLSNAIKFTPRGGRVQVRLERVNSHVEITVADTGQGIAPEFLPHVFDRFRQADQKSTRRHGGLGLGLAIVRQLVELHGGTVRAESEGEGRGAAFTVSLPLLPIRQQPAGEAPRPRPPASGTAPAPAYPPELEGLRVLVVDDDEDSRVLVKKVLEMCGAEVTAVGSAREALAWVERLRPDVLVSDLGMPGEDGYWLIKQVRALPEGRGGKTPAAALTAYARAEDRVRSLRAGFQNHVNKPAEPQELIAVVANLAGRSLGE